MAKKMILAEAFLKVSGDIPVSDPKVEQRLGRAYDIVRTDGHAYAITPEGEGVYTVFRASTSLTTDNAIGYVVDATTCTCPDYPTARANLCKHRLAIRLYELVHGIDTMDM
jgi:SWIM zinc finger